MTPLRVTNGDGAMLGDAVEVADGWWSRLRGLLGRPPLEPGEGLLITPCRAVHMFGMRYALDVAFLDGAGEVVASYPDLPPGGRTRYHREARHALELPTGTLAATGTRPGSRLAWTAAPSSAAAASSSVSDLIRQPR